ncbi:MAG: hypothetical protein IKR85_00095 [Clostridia bacterium]|nr:hypothetical protein [Clostridia bacterium]
MLKYCENCMLLYEQTKCPKCRSRKGREPQDDDFCKLTERRAVYSSMLAEALTNNGIPNVTRGRLGAGLAMSVGPVLESVMVFVPYSLLDRAREIEEEMFAEDGKSEDETDEAEE